MQLGEPDVNAVQIGEEIAQNQERDQTASNFTVHPRFSGLFRRWIFRGQLHDGFL
ncbi:hypothetical protein D3C71_1917070 [compost metagenome]